MSQPSLRGSVKDAEAMSVHDAVHETAFDSATVKRYKYRTDFILLPILTLAYLFNSLDRSNISNSHTDGLADDLGLKGNQYNQVLTYYQIPFIALGPVTTVVTKWVGARYSIAGMLIGFGASSLATGFVKNFPQLVACRLLVGAFESGFLASVMYYLSTWYTRRELASRIGIFYAALVASSAFGGLLAYGVFHIHSASYPSWSYLFFLEGSLTMLWAIFCLFALPSDIHEAWWLSSTEKEVAQLRLEQDSVQHLKSSWSWGEAITEFKSFHGYLRLFMSFFSGVILTSNANFLAMIVVRLGYGTVKTNLYTVAPALTGAVLLVVWCKVSDRIRERGFVAASAVIVSLVGYILLMTVDTNNTAVLYFAMFLCTTGAYPFTPIGAAWTMNNVPNLNARVFLQGIYIAVGNCGGLVSANIYLAQESPRYITALRVNISMCALLIASTISYSTWMRFENRRRDSQAEGVESDVTGDIKSNMDPRFRFEY